MQWSAFDLTCDNMPLLFILLHLPTFESLGFYFLSIKLSNLDIFLQPVIALESGKSMILFLPQSGKKTIGSEVQDTRF